MKAKTDAKMTVVCGAKPACVPMVTPIISPIIHPTRQCKLAARAIRLVEFFCIAMIMIMRFVIHYFVLMLFNSYRLSNSSIALLC